MWIGAETKGVKKGTHNGEGKIDMRVIVREGERGDAYK